jgi:hypothetical protein
MVDIALGTKLRRARRYWALLDAVAGAGWLLAACLAAAVLCFHVDRILVLSPAVREGLNATALVLALVGAGLLIALPLARRRTDEAVATRVERRFPDLGERLLSTVELAHAPEAHRTGISAGMVRALATETAKLAAPLRFETAFGAGAPAIGVGFAALMTAIALLHVQIMPEAMRAWWLRMTNPYGGVPVYRNTRVRVEPRHAVVLRGTVLPVRVTTEGRAVDHATLRFRFGDGPWSTVRLSQAPFTHKFTGLTDEVSFYALAGDGRSDTGQVRVTDAPTVIGIDGRYRFPAYMSRPDEQVSGASGTLRAPIGTRVALTLRANKALERCDRISDQRPTTTSSDQRPTQRPAPERSDPWAIDDDAARGDLLVRTNTTVEFALKDREGFANMQPVTVAIQAVRDRAPEVRIERPGGDRELVPDGGLAIEGNARDDYGVRSVRIRYTVEGSAPRSGSLTLAQGDRTQRGVEAAARWNLGSLALKPGESVRYHLEADDWDNITGPNIGRSSEYRIRVIDRSEMEQRLAELRQDLQRALETLIRDQRAAREQVEALRRARASREAIAAAEARQRALAQQAAEAAARLAELSQALESNRMASPQELAAQEAARRALSQLANQAMPQAADRMQQAQNASNPQSDLAAASEQQAEILRQLENLREATRPEDDLQRLAAWAARLAQAERDLRSATERRLPQTLGLSRSELSAEQRTALDQLAQAQGLTRQSTEQLRERLGTAVERLRATDANASELAREAARQMESLAITERQAETEGRLRDNALASAATQAGGIARDLQRIAEDLGARMSVRRPRGADAADREREETRRRLAQLALRQRAVNTALERLEGTANDPPPGADVHVPQDASRELSQLARKQGEIGSAAANLQPRLPSDVFRGAMQEARGAMQQARQGMVQQQPGGVTRQSAERAQQLLEQMARALQNEQRQQQGGGEGGGGEGGGGQPDPELQRRLSDLRLLRAMEQGIHSETQELDRQPEETAGRRERLDQLSRQQAGTRAMTERAARALQRYGALSRRVGAAGGQMSEAHQGLQSQVTGDPTQQAESRAIDLLSQAIQQMQQMAGQASGRGRRPGNRPGQRQGQQRGTGSQPALESLARPGSGEGGARSGLPPGGSGFGPLSPREQKSLREGWREKIPPDYADLINEYYRALSRHGKQ